jgi:Tol biopolymer transport system component
MRAGKILSIAVVSLASVIVIGGAAIAVTVFVTSRRGSQQNFAPSEGQQAVSPMGGSILISQTHGDSSFLYRKDLSNGKSVRLTAAVNGIESEATFSHNGELVVYSFASSPDSKSAVWMVGADGRNPHAITGNDEDALHPVFSPDDSKVFYGASSFTGNHSPIVRPARHDWDVFSVPVQSNATTDSSTPTQVTHASFYDLQSLDIVADALNQGGTKLLISTTGYPIGALIEEFNLGASGRNKIFQPHVPGESSVGPAYGEARFIHDGMDILFLAATDTLGGNYDYNIYSMSDVTGSSIKQLTHLKGMTKELKVLPDGKATFMNGGMVYALDISTQTVKPL